MKKNIINSLPINADRICEAISKIGYNPSSAIMDIIDNSFMAGAKNISIKIYLKEGMNINNIKNIEKIYVIDDGKGMNDEGITKALELGSDVEYGNNSLSKYGLGLKSAGFSLGRRIEVVSKTTDVGISDKYFLDRDIIKSTGKFGYCIEEKDQLVEDFLNDYKTGTVVSFHNLIYTSRISAQKLSEDLSKKMGVFYSEFLDKEDVSFKVQIFDSKSNEIRVKEIKSRDLLFWSDSLDAFIKEDYDCKKPCKVLDKEFENPINPTGERIKIQATIFPKDSMKNFAKFNEDERKRIKEYDVSLKNSGFYFYRNGRLIKWGEKVFLNREFGIRIKVSFKTEHDELFDVDVSKQHLTISEEVESILKQLVAVPRNQAKEVFELCDIKVKNSKKHESEGSEFNNSNTALEEDGDESIPINLEETKKRKEILEENSKEFEQETLPKYEDEEKQDTFRRVRYWNGNRNRTLWEAGYDNIEGSYVLIDKNHPYYDLAISRNEPDSPYRQTIEAIFHSLAVGQNQTVEKFYAVDGDLVLEIFKKFLRATSQQLDNWVNNNWDLFENED
ncbi:ATP-binding protein [Tenacibaculum sp. 47A_GOM-205m]|uniref:ATP-binding protein n=1 Tax=Tenacibaculum sp. 47A_GOM-205m TaxID=1380384 RepID=UPI00048F00D5|nr:ATP-binding protein [Tenacibaculum sp. 47A_GOM-205m]